MQMCTVTHRRGTDGRRHLGCARACRRHHHRRLLSEQDEHCRCTASIPPPASSQVVLMMASARVQHQCTVRML